MNERLLQFIWQFQYINKSELETVTGETLQVIFPGNFNRDQGPDFSAARIRLGQTTWAGNIEIHLKTSDWKKHQHDDDSHYRNVILHVVWEHDEAGNGLPVLELRQRVSKILLRRYTDLMNSVSFIPCENSIRNVKDIVWQNWKERMLAERLTRKANMISTYLDQNNQHWEETFWWLLARNFGIKVNADAFEQVARSIPVSLLARHKMQIHQLEALLMGQAGLLNEVPEKMPDQDLYPVMLKKEYHFLKKKYKLSPVQVPVFFLRMRPSSFPTIRLSQLAALVQQSAHLFSKIREAENRTAISAWFDVTANDYWHHHYRFGEPSPFRKKKPGASMINNILINTIAPVLFAYGQVHREQKYKDKAFNWLVETEAEKNTITRGFENLGIENKNARDSQALIELKNEYCSKKRCLDCSVGNAILKS